MVTLRSAPRTATVDVEAWLVDELRATSSVELGRLLAAELRARCVDDQVDEESARALWRVGVALRERESRGPTRSPSLYMAALFAPKEI
jgi:hypothetical protein